MHPRPASGYVSYVRMTLSKALLERIRMIVRDLLSLAIIGLKSRSYEMQVGGDRDPSCSRAGVQNHVTIPTVVYLLIW